ncbi:MAG TPA: hypothetical protein VJ873_05635, partial [bacterium]|nr:hypothetical protein [bacterium]
MKHFLLFLIFVLLPWGPAAAQGSLPANSAQVVSAQGYPSLRPLHAGTLFTVAVVVQVKEGWHINAHEGLPEG